MTPVLMNTPLGELAKKYAPNLPPAMCWWLALVVRTIASPPRPDMRMLYPVSFAEAGELRGEYEFGYAL